MVSGPFRRALLVLALSLSLLTLAPAASAQTYRAADDRGSVPGMNVSRLKVTNGKHAVSAKLRFRSLRRSTLKKATFTFQTRRKTGRIYYLTAVRKKRGQRFVHGLFMSNHRGGNLRRVHCGHARVRISFPRNVVRFKVPRACLSARRGKIRAFADTKAFNGRHDHTPDTPWIRRA